MQMLFQWDMSQQDPAKLEAKFWKSAKGADKTREFANQLFEGAAKDAGALDEIIGKHCENWRLERLAALDPPILPLGGLQIGSPPHPPKIVLHEGVGIANKLSFRAVGVGHDR